MGQVFQHLNAAQTSLTLAKEYAGRASMISDDLHKTPPGKKRRVAGNVSRSMKKALVTGFLALLVLSLRAGDYWVLNDTNLVPLLTNQLGFRSFPEPIEYHTISSNWSDTISVPGTNGLTRLYQVQTIVTNHALKFTYKGREYFQPIGQESGPVVAHRTMDIPTSLNTTIMRNGR